MNKLIEKIYTYTTFSDPTIEKKKRRVEEENKKAGDGKDGGSLGRRNGGEKGCRGATMTVKQTRFDFKKKRRMSRKIKTNERRR